jgi:hypothetical protein
MGEERDCREIEDLGKKKKGPHLLTQEKFLVTVFHQSNAAFILWHFGL